MSLINPFRVVIVLVSPDIYCGSERERERERERISLSGRERDKNNMGLWVLRACVGGEKERVCEIESERERLKTIKNLLEKL